MLLVEVPADDAELLLVVVRAGILVLLAAALDGLVHEPAHVVVMERERLAIGGAHRFAGADRARDRRALDDEPGIGLEEDDAAHALLVEVGAHGAQDLFPVLSRASLVDPHRRAPRRWRRVQSGQSTEPARAPAGPRPVRR